MRLKQEVLQKINKPRPRALLGLALGVTEQAIIRYIKKNSPRLTNADALKVIREETNLLDAEILEEETQPETVPA